jgi:hypothetical protein
MSHPRFAIDFKHDTKQKKWKRLSVITLSVEAIDTTAFHQQYCADHQFNPDQVAYRIVEVNSSHIGSSNANDYVRIVKTEQSAATQNKPSH